MYIKNHGSDNDNIHTKYKCIETSYVLGAIWMLKCVAISQLSNFIDWAIYQKKESRNIYDVQQCCICMYKYVLHNLSLHNHAVH